MSNTVELIITKSKQLYPKAGKYNDGDYAIVSCVVNESIKGEPHISEWGNIVVVGKMPYMKGNTKYKFIGVERYDEKRRSYSYEVGFMDEYTNRLTQNDFEMYLEDVLTPSQFKKLQKIPDLKIYLDNKDINKLTQVKGIGESTAKRIIEKYSENKENASFIAKLSALGVTGAMRKNLLDRYKSYGVVISKITNNPYILAEDVNGIGFAKADELALKSGMTKDDPRRIRGAIYFILNSRSMDGQSYIYLSDMVNEIVEKIYEGDVTKLDKILLGQVLKDMLENKIIWASENREYIGLYEVYLLEKSLAKEIIRISSQKNKFRYKLRRNKNGRQNSCKGWRSGYYRKGRRRIYHGAWSERRRLQQPRG